MVIFDQLRVSDDGKRLFIDVHVNKASAFDSYSITALTITTSDYVQETTSGVPTDFIYKILPTKRVIPGEGALPNKELNLMLEIGDLDTAFSHGAEPDPRHPMINGTYASIPYNGTTFSGPLFFVYVECEGEYSQCTPCFADEPTLGVTFDGKLLYQQAMGYTKELADDCTISDGFIDFILTYSAFKSAVETDHYCDAKTFYNQLLGISKDTPKKIGRRCGCHG